MSKILVIGSGGREHALCWRLKQSPSVSQVFCAPGNAGIAQDVSCMTLNDNDAVVAFCKENTIALVVIGPEQPLVDGLTDRLKSENIPVFGPSQKAAQLEASKGFMKDLCQKYNIPTAAYGFFDNKDEALTFLSDKTAPIVVKVDGLAAGKGVIIAQTLDEAKEAVESMFSGQFGEAGQRVVIEEFLDGKEVSFFALCDGKNAIEFGFAQDHKRVGDGDTGPNTGGMGTYSPPPIMTDALRKTVMDTIIHPTMAAMEKEGCSFTGVLFAGLMLTATGPKLLEYNVRFGDPETQSLMMRFNGDLYQLLRACADGNANTTHLSFHTEAAVCVVMAAKGYPGTYAKGSVINSLKKAGSFPGVKIFHAGTAEKEGQIVSVGGRVLGVTALGSTIKEAQQKAYSAVDIIDWPEGFCRRDIAWQAV